MTKVLSLLGFIMTLFTSAGAQSLYIKNSTGCGIDIILRGHDAVYSPVACNLGSSTFNVGANSTLVINDLSDLNCSLCTPASWIIPAGAPWATFSSGPFSGAGWDAGNVRTSGCSPAPCSFVGVGPGCTGVSTVALPGCAGATVLWVYISVNDTYELTVY